MSPSTRKRSLAAPFVVGTAAITMGLIASMFMGRTAAQSKSKPIVLVELFTSEGCSSCPPADDVLARLAGQQLADGVEVLALGEHVDYWDRQGWRDPFSSAASSQRQAEYHDRVFRSSEVYTPQLVVDGEIECIGSNVRAVREAVMKASHRSKAAVLVAAAPGTGRDLRVTVRIDQAANAAWREAADVFVAVTEDRLVTNVRGGENRGRTLTHAAVVRSLTKIGAVKPDDAAPSTTAVVRLAPEWNSGNLRIIGFVQERRSRRIVGAGAADFPTR